MKSRKIKRAHTIKKDRRNKRCKVGKRLNACKFRT
jgi:hypothetical protein